MTHVPQFKHCRSNPPAPRAGFPSAGTLLAAGLWFAAACAPTLQAAPVGADAVVLVNSASARYPDFKRYLQPYLDHFGVPYSVLDLATNSVGTNLGSYALIVIGHSQLDTNRVRLDPASQANISLAVSNGTGLVNFDNTLSGPTNSPFYQYVQDVFRFNYSAGTWVRGLSLPATEPLSQMHYVTARHPTNDSLGLNGLMNLPGLVLPTNATAIATSSGNPLLVVAKFGQGRAVQWGSYDWMSLAIKGPMAGLDDLVWRGMVWAARKPFVLRGLPNFVTLRVDDVVGDLWWAHVAIETGFKPWIGPFISDMTPANVADLRGMVTNGDATASVHSFRAGDFLYWDHFNATNWSDAAQSNKCYAATQWHLTNGIPFAKIVVPHYSEIGPNAFAWVRGWGTEFLTVKNPPGTARGALWLVDGPYRLYEPPQAGSAPLPLFYADFLTVPNHPEFNGVFFDCVTEIRDDAACGEWCPDNDVVASAGRGTRQVKRALDGLALATLYTHEFYIHPGDGPTYPTITTNNWRATLQSITNNLAPYQPIYVTMDFACQYVRATRTARLVTSQYDPGSGTVTAAFSGQADLPLQFQAFVGEDSGIIMIPGTVPVFSGSVTSSVAVGPVPSAVQIRGPLSNQAFELSFFGSPNLVYQVHASTDMVNWEVLTNVTSPSGALNFLDLGASNFSHRFYRAMWAP